MRKLALMFLGLLLLPCSFAYAADDYVFGWDEAAEMYGVDQNILRAISWVESRHKATAIASNNDGSCDVGHMQINSYWRDVSKLKGKIWWRHLRKNPAYCTKVGAWIFAANLNQYGNIQDALAAYNTGRPLYMLKGERLRDAKEYIRKVQLALDMYNQKETEKCKGLMLTRR